MDKPQTTELAEIQLAIQPYRKQVNDTPELLSILYDLDLLPEQIQTRINAMRLVAFCDIFRRLPCQPNQ